MKEKILVQVANMNDVILQFSWWPGDKIGDNCLKNMNDLIRKIVSTMPTESQSTRCHYNSPKINIYIIKYTHWVILLNMVIQIVKWVHVYKQTEKISHASSIFVLSYILGLFYWELLC